MTRGSLAETLSGPGDERSGMGQTLPSDGCSANDRSRMMSGSPPVGSRASAERRMRSLANGALIDDDDYGLASRIILNGGSAARLTLVYRPARMTSLGSA